ncbi:MAG: hypothetical protein H6741_00255 [Alphaproteobacteria bacterium]|nr:hypothetical protein [Alphaproteobacteria bacterium]MCB9791136.1 hypothetical protein [Alphaproteobacteria bacterium]
MKDAPATRLFVLVARDAPVAVVLRRGPSKQVRMLLWDLQSDQLTGGQWLAGRIYPERCGLSPDGRLLVYFCGKFKGDFPTFTAISRPPYFTALALWPDNSTWGGGGFFESDRKVILHYGAVPHELHGGQSIPDHMTISHMGEYRARHPEDDPASAHGWTLTEQGSKGDWGRDDELRLTFERPWVHQLVNPRRLHLVLERRWLGMFEVNGPASVHSYRLLRHPGGVLEDLGRLDWAGWGHDGSLLTAAEGRLVRRRLDQDPVEIADLRAQRFKRIPPPAWATFWPRRGG